MHQNCYLILLLYFTTLLLMASTNNTLLVPESDDRLYRVIRLDNEMQVMLISDPESEKVSSTNIICTLLLSTIFRLALPWMFMLEAFSILKKHLASHISWVNFTLPYLPHRIYYLAIRIIFLIIFKYFCNPFLFNAPYQSTCYFWAQRSTLTNQNTAISLMR